MENRCRRRCAYIPLEDAHNIILDLKKSNDFLDLPEQIQRKTVAFSLYIDGKCDPEGSMIIRDELVENTISEWIKQ